MKKTLLFLIVFTMLPVCAKDVIHKTTDGTVMKCTYKMTQGDIKEYNKNKPFYYTFRDGKLYGRDFFELFASSWRQKHKQDIPKVLFLKVKEDKITFREYAGTDTGTVSQRVKIDRKTGKAEVKALRMYHWSGKTMYRKKAECEGKCVIVK